MRVNKKGITINYITIMNWFWLEVPHTVGYRPLYGILFFAIVDGINRNFWQPNTIMDYGQLFNKCKFTKEVYLNGRNWLAENNFIEFIPGKNNMQMASFSIGSAVGIHTGHPTGTLTDERQENLPGSLPITLAVTLPNIKPKTNKHLKDKLKTIDINISFDEFWKLYDKKIGHHVAEKLWIDLTNEERSETMEHIPLYKMGRAQEFQKDPANYLRQKTFKDQIRYTKAEPVSIYSRESTYKSSSPVEAAYLDRLRRPQNSFMPHK